jgi:hypothetical protein
MSSWQNLEQFPLIGAWQCDRSQSISVNGVSDVITLHLQDARNGELMMIVMSLETAHRMGWDMIGEAGDFFGKPITDTT